MLKAELSPAISSFSRISVAAMGKPLCCETFCLEFSEKGKTNPEDYADKVTEILDAIRQHCPRQDLTVSWVSEEPDLSSGADLHLNRTLFTSNSSS